jgi:ribose transport system substrate-binding protein
MRYAKFFMLGILAAAVGCGTSTGSGGMAGSGGTKMKIAIVSNNPEEFWTIAERGAEKAAKDFDCQVTFRKPDKGEVQAQRDIVNALAEQGVQGLAVSVIDPVNQTPDLKLLAGKLKLITMDNDAEGSGRICYVGTDNLAAGKSAGKLVARALPKGGKVAVFVGQISPLNARQRFDGVMAALKEAENANGVKYELYRNEAITDGANREQAQVNARQALEAIGSEPNVALVGLWAYNAPAILEAAKSKGLAGKVKIVAFDEMDATLTGIAAGEIEGTVVQDPFNFAYQSVEILVAEIKGDASKRTKTAVPHRVISKDGNVPAGETAKGMTADEFKKDMDAKLKK